MKLNYRFTRLCIDSFPWIVSWVRKSGKTCLRKYVKDTNHSLRWRRSRVCSRFLYPSGNRSPSEYSDLNRFYVGIPSVSSKASSSGIKYLNQFITVNIPRNFMIDEYANSRIYLFNSRIESCRLLNFSSFSLRVVVR